jgi:nitrite reductase/ring-hydroxylating ferredoxin subunit
MLEYHYCEKLSYFPEEKIRRFFRGGKEIAVVQVGGKLHAFSNRCTHNDFQLHFGFVEDGCIWCPIHYGVFELASGRAKSGPVTDLETFEVKVEGDEVYVGVERQPVDEAVQDEEIRG